ncbi:MAG: hypothetical protein ABIQ39_13250, partial [Ilumatobacteraceae bacterium]
MKRVVESAGNRIRVAQWIGHHAVDMVLRDAAAARQAMSHTPATADVVGDTGPAEPGGSAGTARSDADDVADSTVHSPYEGGVARRDPPAAMQPEPPVAFPAGGHPNVPFDGYDTLAATHIVARLARLDPAELAQIRIYELANRGRR